MGPTPAYPLVFTGHTKKLIQIKARQLCRRHGFSPSEHDDIQQELWLRLVARAHHFNPDRGSPEAFVERVVCSGVCVILRQRCRQRRLPWFQALSLEETMVEIDGTPTPVGQAISKEDLHRRMGTTYTDDVERHEDAVTLDQAIGSMSPGLRNLCQRLANGSAHSAARSLNTSRRQVRNDIRVIHKQLELAGFGFF